MNKADIRAAVDQATGSPVVGPVADVIPAIVDAIDAALNPAAPEESKRAKRVTEVSEKR